MSRYTSYNGEITLSFEAWGHIQRMQLDGGQTVKGFLDSYESTVEHGDGVLHFDLYGSNMDPEIDDVFDFIAALKDKPETASLEYTNHEEIGKGVVFLWPGDWEFQEFVVPAPPDEETKLRASEQGGRLILKDGKVVRSEVAQVVKPRQERFRIDRARVLANSQTEETT